MSQNLLVFKMFCTSCLRANAQTKTWTMVGAYTNCNTIVNWSLNAVQTASCNVTQIYC